MVQITMSNRIEEVEEERRNRIKSKKKGDDGL